MLRYLCVSADAHRVSVRREATLENGVNAQVAMFIGPSEVVLRWRASRSTSYKQLNVGRITVARHRSEVCASKSAAETRTQLKQHRSKALRQE